MTDGYSREAIASIFGAGALSAEERVFLWTATIAADEHPNITAEEVERRRGIVRAAIRTNEQAGVPANPAYNDIWLGFIRGDIDVDGLSSAINDRMAALKNS